MTNYFCIFQKKSKIENLLKNAIKKMERPLLSLKCKEIKFNDNIEYISNNSCLEKKLEMSPDFKKQIKMFLLKNNHPNPLKQKNQNLCLLNSCTCLPSLVCLYVCFSFC